MQAMSAYTFKRERTCPVCKATFASAEQKVEFDPVIIVLCPKCGRLLWRAGCEEDAPLVVFDPTSDSGGI
jgi:predicted RNA-binding Zn-ribbon protein involved in translation (DUF1610 family)